MAKYPGSQILFEVGTRSDLANIYGVSERTIYRWLNKAAAESGLSPRVNKKMPKASTLAKFKGTRKQLAQKYGVSERTVYRWLNKARGDVIIPDRKARSKYPGAAILNEKGTNQELADSYGVSKRTISRWKAKARLEITSPTVSETAPYQFVPETPIDDLFSEPTPEEFAAPDIPGQDIDFTDEIPEEFEDYADFDISEDMFGNLKNIRESILNNDLSGSEIFKSLTYKEQILYMNNYLMYQYDQDPSQFYDPVTHKFRFDTEWVTQFIDIWGDEFDEWVSNQFDSDMYEI